MQPFRNDELLEEQINKLVAAYPERLWTRQTVQLFSQELAQMLHDRGAEALIQAVSETIKRQPKPPSVADIYNRLPSPVLYSSGFDAPDRKEWERNREDVRQFFSSPQGQALKARWKSILAGKRFEGCA